MSVRQQFMGAVLAGCALAQNYDPRAIQEANQGVALAKKEEYGAAIEAYRRALAIDGRLPHLYLNLGLAYFKQGKFRDALTALGKEAASDQVLTLVGMSYFGLREYKRAAETLAPLTTKQPANAELGYLLAKCYMWSGESERAMQIFQQLLERNPESPQVHMLYAEALDAAGRDKEATEEFEVAVKNGPGQPEVHFGLGYLYWKQKRYPEAEQQFRTELRNNPQHALSLAYTGDIMLRDGRKGQALSMLTKAEALNRNLHVVHQDLGIWYQEADQTGAALKEFQEAVRTSPDNYDAHYRLARIYREMGRKEDAAKEFATVQRLHEQKKPESLMKISGPQ